MDDYISPSGESGLADRASSQASKWAPDVQGVQLQRPNMSFACTDFFGPHNIEKRIMVKKAVKRYCSNNLKNVYEIEEFNSQDSEHEDKKSNNQYSECDDKEETYAYYNETL